MENSNGPAGKVRVVFVTVPDQDAGVELARRAVQEGLAACGNVIPGLTSVYRWDGAVQEDPEALVVFKTTLSAWHGFYSWLIGKHLPIDDIYYNFEFDGHKHPVNKKLSTN